MQFEDIRLKLIEDLEDYITNNYGDRDVKSLFEYLFFLRFGGSLDNIFDSQVSLRDTNFNTIEGPDLQKALLSLDELILNARNTGVRYGGVATTDGQTVSISAGSGSILDLSNPSTPNYVRVKWEDVNNVSQHITPGPTYWYVNSAGDLLQSTIFPTNNNYRERIYLFYTFHDGTKISALGNISVSIQNLSPTLKDLDTALGPIKVQGLAPTSSGQSLRFKITAGNLYNFGGGRWVDSNSPNNTILPEYSTAGSDTFRYLGKFGLTTGNTLQDINPSIYQVNGVETAIPGNNNRASIQFIIRFQSGNIRLILNDEWYRNLDAAVLALNTIDPYSLVSSTINRFNSIVLGAVVARKDATDLSNSNKAKFITTNRFGLFGGGIVSSGLRLTDLNDVNLPGEPSQGDLLGFNGTNWGIVQSSVYDSQNTDITSLNQTFTHGLNAVPKQVDVSLVCKVANNGYSVGDVLPITSLPNNGTDFYNVSYNANEVNIRLSSFSYNILSLSLGILVPVVLNTNWSYRVRVY